jgi:4-amino-4-deoxy-L-arabinose transferase-like glycosyltransferase
VLKNKNSRNPLAAPAATVSKNRAHDAPGDELYRPAMLLAFIWLSFIFVFFSFSTTKLPNYVLPSVPAACLLIASGISERWGSWKRYEYAVLSCLSMLLGVALIISRTYLSKAGIDETGWVLTVAAILIAMAGAGLYVALRKKESYGAFAALMFAFLLVLSVKALPLVNGYMQGALHKFSLYAKQTLPAGDKVIVYRINNPSIVFYSDHEVQEIGDPGELLPLLREGRKLLVIAKTSDLDSLKNAGLALKEKIGNYALLEGK